MPLLPLRQLGSVNDSQDACVNVLKEGSFRFTNQSATRSFQDYDTMSSSSSESSGSKADLSTSNASSRSGQEMLEEKELMFQRESQHVTMLKRAVLLIMLLAGIAISTVVYFVSSKAQYSSFASTYFSSSEKLLETFHHIAEGKLGAVSSLTVAATAHALDSNTSYPFTTLSAFQHRAIPTRAISGALLVTMHPLVTLEQRNEWEQYSFHGDAAQWHARDLEYEKSLSYGQYDLKFDAKEVVQRVTLEETLTLNGMANHIFTLDEEGDAIIERSNGPFLPTWETSPVFIRTLVNRNLLTDPSATHAANASISTGSVTMGNFEFPVDEIETKLYTTLLSISKKRVFPYVTSPLTRIYLPIFDSFDEATKKPVALLVALIRWESYFVNVLPDQIRGINMVLDNNCGDVYTFKITGHEPDPVGLGDLHDDKFEHMRKTATFADVATVDDGSPHGVPLYQDECTYQMTSYPTQLMLDDYRTNLPALITFAVAMVFVFTFVMFLVYDRLVERRQNLVLHRAVQTTKIVQSLFPKSVADKLMQHSPQNDLLSSKNQKLNKFLGGDEQGKSCIADLFPACTVLFADISGFTAWSSTRDPSQVFQLLEAIYNSFDEIAKSRKVFKVETVGDCYVAVTGLPDPQASHAVIMARFASECMIKMTEVTQKLETTLGPDTTDLRMRVGLHSGPVTAGVLRGDKSRFQLFGDTVNTASRMESTGVRERIQVSQDTATLLTLAGKGHWLTPREDAVNAKGKGVLRTFWLRTQTKKLSNSVASSGTHSSDQDDVMLDAAVPSNENAEAALRRDRKVDWMTELLSEFLKQIIVKRAASPFLPSQSNDNNVDQSFDLSGGLIGIDEVVESITLAKFDADVDIKDCDWREIEINSTVHQQLREYVSIIASMYRDSNPFHNFEHACHVTMSVAKHLKRIVAPDLEVADEEEVKACINDKDKTLALLHSYTLGINSDPLAHFAIVFSALIHDVDHRGVSNVQSAKEEPLLADHFKHQSLAEQNSLEIASTLLMTDQFADLRRMLFANMTEYKRFRQIVVNEVMATDIFDPQLGALRKSRWEKAFAPEACNGIDQNTLRATIVLEHIIQASDVSHTMQHWHIYRKWNRLLFRELTIAYRSNRMAVDPASFWYKGELGFFDNYVIPLAKKLKECKVFGVNSDECLNYATRNRAEWEVRGEEVVAELVRECEDLVDSSGDAGMLFC
ncbi:hypothetical protein MPSEU_000581200 [Mayamaea pseudoterrestris]|nr:hypothetical protein MPSEU_000581200 [Mayamaea pseudoterrestris]